MLRLIDRFIDRITMYRLLIYYLAGLLIVAAVLSQFGYLHYSWVGIVLSALYLLVVCLISNALFAHAWRVPVNQESTYITALILALIITPARIPQDVLFLTAAGGLAIASKYMLAYRGKHIFNPAAIAVLLTNLGGGQAASWWVGNAPMLVFVVLGGLWLVRKIRRCQMVLSFLATTFVATAFYSLITNEAVGPTLQKTALSSAVFFLAFVMLTEPLTSPTTLKKQRWYGVLAGLIFPPQVHFFSYYSTPELALIIGNIYAYYVSPRVKALPRLIKKVRLSPSTVDFIFQPDRAFAYQPGQYMEFTLPHARPDNRGERRYLTLASSPTEPTLRLGVKFYEKSSSYKTALWDMDETTPFAAGQLSGDFVLPKDPSQKLAFIAGGIGITPFRSMVKYLLDTGEKRSVSMLYSAATPEELVYTDVFEEARRAFGMQTIYHVTDATSAPPNVYYRRGLITAEAIAQEIPDYLERMFYLSGTHEMVIAVKTNLRHLGVPLAQIKEDFFPGYA